MSFRDKMIQTFDTVKANQGERLPPLNAGSYFAKVLKTSIFTSTNPGTEGIEFYVAELEVTQQVAPLPGHDPSPVGFQFSDVIKLTSNGLDLKMGRMKGMVNAAYAEEIDSSGPVTGQEAFDRLQGNQLVGREVYVKCNPSKGKDGKTYFNARFSDIRPVRARLAEKS